MKKLLLILLIVPFTLINAQRIGEMAPEKPPEDFPDNMWGVDLMFGEGGFGLGTFLRHSFSNTVTGFVDFSLSEVKDDREIEYIDIFGNSFVVGKENRVFQFPLNFGIQYRMFSKTITPNLRPYVALGAGPSLIVTTPYDKEFFDAFGKAKAHYGAGGYIGLGANIGLSKTNLVGINVRYSYTRVFGEGVENLEDNLKNDIKQFSISINVGIMY